MVCSKPDNGTAIPWVALCRGRSRHVSNCDKTRQMTKKMDSHISGYQNIPHLRLTKADEHRVFICPSGPPIDALENDPFMFIVALFITRLCSNTKNYFVQQADGTIKCHCLRYVSPIAENFSILASIERSWVSLRQAMVRGA